MAVLGSRTPRTIHLKPGPEAEPQGDIEVDTRLQSSPSKRRMEEKPSDALVQGGTQAWTQSVPTNEHIRALEGPAAYEFFWVCSSVGRGPLPLGEKAPSPEASIEPAVVANDLLIMYLLGALLTCSHKISLLYG